MCFPLQTQLKYEKKLMKQLMDANCAMFICARLVTNLFMTGNRNTNDLLTFYTFDPSGLHTTIGLLHIFELHHSSVEDFSFKFQI